MVRSLVEPLLNSLLMRHRRKVRCTARQSSSERNVVIDIQKVQDRTQNTVNGEELRDRREQSELINSAEPFATPEPWWQATLGCVALVFLWFLWYFLAP